MIRVSTPPRLWIEVFLWRQGTIWPLISGLLILALALSAVEQLQLKPAVQVSEQALQQVASDLRAARKKSFSAATKSEGNADEHRQMLQNALYARAEVTSIVRALHASAVHHDLRVLSSDFQLQASGVDGIARQTVSMPFQANYQAFKQFLLDALRKHPGVSVDQISIKREVAMQGQPEVLVKFSIWTRTEPRSTDKTDRDMP